MSDNERPTKIYPYTPYTLTVQGIESRVELRGRFVVLDGHPDMCVEFVTEQRYMEGFDPPAHPAALRAEETDG